MEVKQHVKYWITKNKCCYCKRNALIQKTMTVSYILLIIISVLTNARKPFMSDVPSKEG